MHHLTTDPEIEVSADQLEDFLAKHGGNIEFDNTAGRAHWDHPTLPVRYVARVTAYPVDSTSYALPDGRTVIGRDAYEAEMVKAVFAPKDES